jgi:hypothetical protein
MLADPATGADSIARAMANRGILTEAIGNVIIEADKPCVAPVAHDNVRDTSTKPSYGSTFTTTPSSDDEAESEELHRKSRARPSTDTEVNDVMGRIYRMRREKEVAERSRLGRRGCPKGRSSGEKRHRENDEDAHDDESVEDEATFTRTLVYCADAKDLFCDNHHETIEKSVRIEKIMKDAMCYLSYVPSIHTTWSKNEEGVCRLVSLLLWMVLTLRLLFVSKTPPEEVHSLKVR